MSPQLVDVPSCSLVSSCPSSGQNVPVSCRLSVLLWSDFSQPKWLEQHVEVLTSHSFVSWYFTLVKTCWNDCSSAGIIVLHLQSCSVRPDEDLMKWKVVMWHFLLGISSQISLFAAFVGLVCGGWLLLPVCMTQVCTSVRQHVWVCNALLSPLCFTCCPGNPKTPPCHAIGSAQPNELPAASNSNQSRNGTDHMTVCVCVPRSYRSPRHKPCWLTCSCSSVCMCVDVFVPSHRLSYHPGVCSRRVCGDEFSAVLREAIYICSQSIFSFSFACIKHICRHVQQKGFWET